MKKSKSSVDLITANEWMYLFKVLENTNVKGKEVKPFSDLMTKIDVVICEKVEESQTQQVAPPIANGTTNTSSLNDKLA